MRIAAMKKSQREWASGAIADALSEICEYTHAHRIFVYLGSPSEPDTQEIIGLALMLERTVCVPRVHGNEMSAVAISPFSNFKTNKWGILEPVGGQVIEDVDVAVIPLVAFDNLNRLGHGKGYYDRYLSSHDCFKIGLAFDSQEVKGLPIDELDIPLDMLVTEKRIIDCNGERDNKYGVEL